MNAFWPVYDLHTEHIVKLKAIGSSPNVVKYCQHVLYGLPKIGILRTRVRSIALNPRKLYRLYSGEYRFTVPTREYSLVLYRLQRDKCQAHIIVKVFDAHKLFVRTLL